MSYHFSKTLFKVINKGGLVPPLAPQFSNKAHKPVRAVGEMNFVVVGVRLERESIKTWAKPRFLL